MWEPITIVLILLRFIAFGFFSHGLYRIWKILNQSDKGEKEIGVTTIDIDDFEFDVDVE